MVGAIVTNLVSISVMLGNIVLLSILFLFGIFQATGGPVGTAVMGNWFCDADAVKNAEGRYR